MNSMDDIVHEQTIICRQSFASHVVGSLPVKEIMIITIMIIIIIVIIVINYCYYY